MPPLTPTSTLYYKSHGDGNSFNYGLTNPLIFYIIGLN